MRACTRGKPCDIQPGSIRRNQAASVSECKGEDEPISCHVKSYHLIVDNDLVNRNYNTDTDRPGPITLHSDKSVHAFLRQSKLVLLAHSKNSCLLAYGGHSSTHLALPPNMLYSSKTSLQDLVLAYDLDHNTSISA